jgi:cysteine-rich repeat protein
MQKETHLVTRLGSKLALGCTLALAAALAGAGCAKVSQQDPGTGGSDGAAAAGGAGGAAGEDAGMPLDRPIFGEAPPASVCGNGVKEFGEGCDDGNTNDGDGCSSHCQVEPYWNCDPTGKKCTHQVVCGDGMLEAPEACDDGNTTSGDGCASDCTVECGWECPAGMNCRAAMCGDGLVAGKEQCDDGNTTDGDGCSANCTLETKPVGVAEGWLCTSPTIAAPGAADGGTSGGADAATSADGGAADATDTDGGGADGGAAPKTCKGPTTCKTTVCGNGIKEGSEQCDDGNKLTGDGCSPFCRLEPNCPATGGACLGVCGDGILLPEEAMDPTNCDDGNTVAGDGCSAICKVEPGYKCKQLPVNPNPLILPIVYHDFKSYRDTGGHPDFEHYQGDGQKGIVQAMLDPKTAAPVHVPMCVSWTTNMCLPGNANPTWDPAVDWFGMWYVDNATYNRTVVQTLSLSGQVSGTASMTCNMAGQPACTSYQFSSTSFFPIDNAGWGITPTNQPVATHNYGFTSVTRYWFQYSGAATLAFFGDDDVWVFINKTLAVDLGGTHVRTQGSITLDPSNGHGFVCDFVGPGKAVQGMNVNGLATACDSSMKTTGGHDVDLGLKMGSVYEIAVFQAERFTTESNYQLTLSGFNGTTSVCAGACGDGVVSAGEQCDLGAAMNTGAYGGCNPDCTLAPYCGDGKVTDGEECEPSQAGCGADCKKIVIP